MNEYSYSHKKDGPWVEFYDTPAKALEAGRGVMYDPQDERSEPFPIYIAKVKHLKLSEILDIQVVTSSMLGEISERAVLKTGDSGDELISYLDDPKMIDAKNDLAENLKGLLEWWQETHEVPLPAQSIEVIGFEANAPLPGPQDFA